MVLQNLTEQMVLQEAGKAHPKKYFRIKYLSLF
jgi:hypothetical protein